MKRWMAMMGLLVLTGCGPTMKIFTDNTEPLREFTLEGKGDGRVLVISLDGVISNQGSATLLRQFPSPVQEVVSQLDLAASDPRVKAVILKVNSPGGTVTASDILYKELLDFKKKSRAKLVVVMMDVAASGGYYVSLPADHIVAHPTTITGSIGVIFSRLNMAEGMEKLGVGVVVNKSGKDKDMGSPFRPSTASEDKLFQGLTDDMAVRFKTLVQTHRRLSDEQMKDVGTARVVLADEALKMGLIDEVGYIDDAAAKARSMAGLGASSRLVVYRRSNYKNDNVYNSAVNRATASSGAMLSGMPGLEGLPQLRTGFYYLWTGAGAN